MTLDPAILTFPSQAPTPELAALFPKVIVDVEELIYGYVKEATGAGLAAGAPALSFYEDPARSVAEGRTVPVVKGWPAFPGQVPAIGVAAGPETEDQQADAIQGGFAGEARAYVKDAQGNDTTEVLGIADYYSEPLYVPITVELVHENRDERDRLHNQMRMLMLPLRTTLLERTGLIKRVRVDAEKTEAATGPLGEEAPMIAYLSLFTVHVYSEMLVPRDIVDATGVIGRIDVSVTAADTGP